MTLRQISIAACLVAALALVGCATMNVRSYVGPGADFARYRTYDWAADDRLSTGDPRLDNNTIFLARLQGDVERTLAGRGLEKTTGGSPELLLHYHASIYQQMDVARADRTAGDRADSNVSVYDAGTLLLDFVDAQTHELVWRGWAETSLGEVIDNQQSMERVIDEAVTRILAKLPRRL